jgi:hypothetical protein
MGNVVAIFGGSSAGGFGLTSGESYPEVIASTLENDSVKNYSRDLFTYSSFVDQCKEKELEFSNLLVIFHFRAESLMTVNHRLDFLLPKRMRKSHYWANFMSRNSESNPISILSYAVLKYSLISLTILKPKLSQRESKKLIEEILSRTDCSLARFVIVDSSMRQFKIENFLLWRQARMWKKISQAHSKVTIVDYKSVPIIISDYNDGWHLNSSGARKLANILIDGLSQIV